MLVQSVSQFRAVIHHRCLVPYRVSNQPTPHHSTRFHSIPSPAPRTAHHAPCPAHHTPFTNHQTPHTEHHTPPSPPPTPITRLHTPHTTHHTPHTTPPRTARHTPQSPRVWWRDVGLPPPEFRRTRSPSRRGQRSPPRRCTHARLGDLAMGSRPDSSEARGLAEVLPP